MGGTIGGTNFPALLHLSRASAPRSPAILALESKIHGSWEGPVHVSGLVQGDIRDLKAQFKGDPLQYTYSRDLDDFDAKALLGRHITSDALLPLTHLIGIAEKKANLPPVRNLIVDAIGANGLATGHIVVPLGHGKSLNVPFRDLSVDGNHLGLKVDIPTKPAVLTLAYDLTRQ